jgi:ArsR family transcriptional regulator
MKSDVIDVPATGAKLKALANPARLRIALHLLGGEKGVSDIENELGLRQPNLSQYLAELREAGLVTTRREARNVFYALADAQAAALLQALSAPPDAVRPAPIRAPRRHPLAAASFASVGPFR